MAHKILFGPCTSRIVVADAVPVEGIVARNGAAAKRRARLSKNYTVADNSLAVVLNYALGRRRHVKNEGIGTGLRVREGQRTAARAWEIGVDRVICCGKRAIRNLRDGGGDELFVQGYGRRTATPIGRKAANLKIGTGGPDACRQKNVAARKSRVGGGRRRLRVRGAHGYWNICSGRRHFNHVKFPAIHDDEGVLKIGVEH